MTSQPVPSGMFMILTPNGISIPQTQQSEASSSSNSNLKKGLKEESKALGTIQILMGLMILSMGIILACIYDDSYFKYSSYKVVKSGYPFIGGVTFIISGSLSIASERKKTKSLNRFSLAANVVSGIEATAGLILLSAILPEIHEDLSQCLHATHQEKQDNDYVHSYDIYDFNSWACHMAHSALTGIMSVMLIFTGLELSIALFVAFFDWRKLSGESDGAVLFLSRGRHIAANLKASLSNPSYEEFGASA
ncbi:membrane-spanning 4-domains subfamily A member 6D-like [Antechinus flavipes]|uniref:membrane-spanning 4-domains subfamily A member 6D-like n=1 Tax=Antechinus flavipes TaxID=38775 RepID=UPI002235F600|nr:membrane-spanning 4-domains subfamily A member 6D-like [Antechinus flavipes]XP_051820575.1 membrane-spanning 4-domains subfamily A member 6D-like [Antechinus flavipes]